MPKLTIRAIRYVQTDGPTLIIVKIRLNFLGSILNREGGDIGLFITLAPQVLQ